MMRKSSASVHPDSQKHAAAAPAKARYHHGDLPSALVAAATQIIEAGGGASLNLRAAAQAAGVSAAAPYRHFSNREALLAATLAAGFQDLAQRTESARLAAHEPVQALVNAGLAYVQFAAERPRLYRLMFGPECDKAAHPELMQAGQLALDVLRRAVSNCQAAGLIGRSDVRHATLASWALTHGLAALHADGLLTASPAGTPLDSTARNLIGLLIEGVRTRQAPSPSPAKARHARAR